MKKFISKFSSSNTKSALLKDERGLSTVEYVILLVLIAAACIGLWVTFGESLRTKIGAANDEMEQVEIPKSE